MAYQYSFTDSSLTAQTVGRFINYILIGVNIVRLLWDHVAGRLFSTNGGGAS